MMKKEKIENYMSADLVKLYEENALQMHKALNETDVRRYNKIFEKNILIINELKKRPEDHRHYLLPLLDHPDIGVRYQAANTTFAIAPDKARSVLEKIAASHRYPLAGHAGMALDAIDRGISKLD